MSRRCDGYLKNSTGLSLKPVLSCSHFFPPSAADAIAQVQKARQVAAEFEFDNGYAMPVAYLAKKMADENQIYTQVGPRRLR